MAHTNGNGEPNGRNAGLQAYRWWLALGVAGLCFLAYKIDKTVDATATAVADINRTISAFQSTFSAHSLRLERVEQKNEQQDGKLEKLHEEIWKIPRSQPINQAPPMVTQPASREPFEPYPPARR